MPERGLYRGASAKGFATPTNAPIRIDSTTNTPKYIPAGSGSTEIEIIDASAVQTLTNKNFISPVTTISGDGAIAIASGTVILTKGSAAAITLAAPTAAQAGTEISIVAQSAFAHVVTATGLIDDGVTGGSKSAWTSAAFVGSSLTLVAINLKWSVLSKNLGTIA